MVDPLVEKPAKTKDPRDLSYSDAIVGTILPLYSPNLWQHLTQGLSELKDGTGDTMLALADLYMGRDARATTTTPPTCGLRSTASTNHRSPTGPPSSKRIAASGGRAVHERRIHRTRPARNLRVLAGSADQQAARDLGQRAAAHPGGVDDERPRRRIRPASIWPASSAAPFSPSKAPSTPWYSRETSASTTSPRGTWST